MSSSAIRAGAAYVEISTRQGLLEKGIASAQASLRRLSMVASTVGRNIGGGLSAAKAPLDSLAGGVLNLKSAIVGSLAVTGVVAWTRSFADAAGAVDDTAQRTGLTTEAVTELGYAARLTGSDSQTMEKAIRKMSTAIVGAATGSAEAAGKLSQLGLSASMLSSMSPDKQFELIAERLSRIPNTAQRAALAMDIFGKSGAMLTPLLSGGAKGIQDLRDEAAALGVTMSTDDAQAGAKLGDVIDMITTAMGGLKNAIGAAVTPLLIELGGTLTTVISNVSNWIRNNRELIATLGQYLAIGAAVGAGIVALATGALTLSVVLSGVGAAVSGVVALVSGLAAGLAMIISPIGLVVAGIVGATAAFLYFSGTGSQLIEFIGTKFGELRDTVLPILDTIRTALVSGQLMEAGQLLMAGIELAFRIGTRELYGIWTDLTTRLLNAWTDFPVGIAIGANNALTAFQNIMAGVPTSIQNAFSTAFTWLYGAWDSAVNYIAKKLLYLYSLFDRSVDYEAAAKQMDAEAAARADQRQKSLDNTTGARDASLMAANSERLKRRDEINANLTSAADQTKSDRIAAGESRKSEFDARIDSLGREIADMTASINTEAEKRAQAATATAKKTPLELAPVDMLGTQEAARTATTGTFSGFAAGLLGGGTSAIDKLADTSKKQLSTLQTIAENTGRDSELTMDS